MTFMQVKTQKQQEFVSKFVELRDKKSFPDGTHYFVLGVGQVNKNTDGEQFWTDSAEGEDKEVVTVDYGAFWATRTNQEGKVTPIEMKWIANTDETGKIVDNDPVKVLGLDNKDMGLYRKVYPQTPSSIKNAPNSPTRVNWLPVMKLEGLKSLPKKNEVNKLSGEIVHLGLSNSVYQKLLEASEKVVSTGLDENGDMIGRIIVVTINRKASTPSDIYKVDATPLRLSGDVLTQFVEIANKERSDMINYIQVRTFERVNGNVSGVEGANNVWAFITETLGLTKEQVIAKYFVGKKQNVADLPSESINMETVTESFSDDE